MAIRSIASPDDQGATFVELFFDLVFVFAITQVTHYAAHHLDVSGHSANCCSVLADLVGLDTVHLGAQCGEYRPSACPSGDAGIDRGRIRHGVLGGEPSRPLRGTPRGSRCPTFQSGSWASVSTTELPATARSSEWPSVRLLDCRFRVSVLS